MGIIYLFIYIQKYLDQVIWKGENHVTQTNDQVNL